MSEKNSCLIKTSVTLNSDLLEELWKSKEKCAKVMPFMLLVSPQKSVWLVSKVRPILFLQILFPTIVIIPPNERVSTSCKSKSNAKLGGRGKRENLYVCGICRCVEGGCFRIKLLFFCYKKVIG